MIHHMHLNHEPFEKIKTGVKTIELRLNDEKRRQIRVGDRILFDHCSDPSDTPEAEVVAAEVIALHPFEDFRALYASLPLEKCGYATAEEVQNARPEDMLAYYSMEQQQAYGVLGIEIRLL